MTKISSNMFLIKRGFTLLWFGGLAFFLMDALNDRIYEKAPLVIVVICLMAVFGFFFFKKQLWNLADEVYDCGDFLLVKNRGKEDKVALSNIMNVNFTVQSPPKITLSLVKTGKFGTEILFSPISQIIFSKSAKNQVAEDLIVRVNQAKSKCKT